MCLMPRQCEHGRWNWGGIQCVECIEWLRWRRDVRRAAAEAAYAEDPEIELAARAYVSANNLAMPR